MAGDQFVWVGPLQGSWNASADWTEDGAATTNTPGANDAVDITASSDLQVVTGSGDSASLTLSGPIELDGAFVTGALTLDEPFGGGGINLGGDQPPAAGLYIDAGDSLTVTGNAGPPSQQQSLGVQDDTLVGAILFDVTGAAARLTVDGTLTLAGASSFAGNDLTVADGGQVMVGTLTMADGGISVDAASSLEVGSVGGAALGSVTVDPGAIITISSPFNTIAAESIVDNGVIQAVQSGVTISAPISGTGVLDIVVGAEVSVEQVGPGVTIEFGPPLAGGEGGELSVSATSLGVQEQFGAAIAGFGPGDTIDVSGGATSATWSDGVLTLNDGHAVVAELRLIGDYGGDTFSLTQLGGGVAQIEVSAAPKLALHDFNGDGLSDFLIENTSGAVAIGEVAGGSAGYAVVSSLGPEWTFVGDGDFAGDGKADFLIENTSGAVFTGEVGSGGAAVFSQVAALGPEWSFRGAGDFLGDGKSDFLIENTNGAVVVGELESGQAQYTTVANLGPEWKFVGTGDFLGEGHDQFLIENAAGAVDVADWSGGAIHYSQVAGLGAEWTFEGSGDFLGDGKSDFLIENTSGAVVVGEVVDGQAQYTQITALGPEWKFVGAGDFLGEGHDQFLIENAAGAVVVGDWTGGAIHFTQVSTLGSEWFFHA